jgi:hypothetical protein
MTLDDAASGVAAPPEPEPSIQTRPTESAFARAAHLMDYQLHLDKYRREAALRAARERGLDAEANAHTARAPIRPRLQVNPRRMNRNRHAQVLLTETSMPLSEIATLTGLDIYSVVGMKLKLRGTALYHKTRIRR